VSPRSFLFVPGDSERKLSKSVGSGADALILDLEDAVAPDRKPAARELVNAFLRSPRSGAPAQHWVRINALSTADSKLDLAAVAAARPHGLVVPKIDHPAELLELSAELAAIEAREHIAPGATRLIPLMESPRAILAAAEYLRTPLGRLSGIGWGAEDLGAALGIRSAREAGGAWRFALSGARAQCQLVAGALEIDAIDTVTTDFRNLDALRAECVLSYEAGFRGKLAIHPDQVGVINDAFQASTAELEHARRVLAAFEAAPGSGAVSLDGTMLDIVHLRAARRLLDRRGHSGVKTP
jgi:citrate lyase subunit beta/citryl-CoA lyase